MKGVAIMVLETIVVGSIGAIAFAPGAVAQVPKSIDGTMAGSIVPDQSELMAPFSNQLPTPIDLLTPEPISVRRPGEANPTVNTAPTNAQLNEVANSIQAQPQKQGSGDGIPTDLVPKDLIHAPAQRSSDTNPIEFFQVPNPAPSFGINLNTD